MDVLFLYQVSVGTFRPGSLVSGLSMTVTLVLVAAAWLPGAAAQTRDGHGRTATSRTTTSRSHPGCCSRRSSPWCASVRWSSRTSEHVPVVALALAVLGLLVAIARAFLTLTQDRQEARRVLRGKNEELLRFRALVETSGDFIAIALTDGTVTYVNPAGRQLVGLPADADVTTTSITDYLTEDGIARLARGRATRRARLRPLGGGVDAAGPAGRAARSRSRSRAS